MKQEQQTTTLISKSLRIVLNVLLALLAILLIIASFKEIFNLFKLVFTPNHLNYSQVIEEILIFFIFFEFIALIVKYFQSNYHFPLQYFVYIGVTAITRHIIAYQLSAGDTVLLSLAILVLLGTLMLIRHFDLDGTKGF